MKIDCSKTLNYVNERNRMCDSVSTNCRVCPLDKMGDAERGKCMRVRDVTQKHIDIVQKWSDEHPRETMSEHFSKMFQNTSLSDNWRRNICPYHIGRISKEIYDNCDLVCTVCWDRPYIEKE